MTDRRDLQLVLRSRVPIIVIRTPDEGRFLALLSEIAGSNTQRFPVALTPSSLPKPEQGSL